MTKLAISVASFSYDGSPLARSLTHSDLLRPRSPEVADPIQRVRAWVQVAIEGLVVPVVFGRDETGRVDCLAAGGPAFVTLHRRPSVTSDRRGLRASAILAGAGVLRLRRKAVARRMR